jgi:hypothetical protein
MMIFLSRGAMRRKLAPLHAGERVVIVKIKMEIGTRVSD